MGCKRKLGRPMLLENQQQENVLSERLHITSQQGRISECKQGKDSRRIHSRRVRSIQMHIRGRQRSQRRFGASSENNRQTTLKRREGDWFSGSLEVVG